MELAGEYRIAARRETVWAGLNNPDLLKACLPEHEGMVVELALSDLDPAQSLTINGESHGGAIGTVSGGAHVTLADDDEGTLLRYAIRAHVSSRTAQLGSRVIDTMAGKLADDFFGVFAAKMGAEEPTVKAPPLATPGADDAAEEELIDRLEHRVEDFADDVAEAAEEAEQEVEVAAGRGFLGGPYVWGLLVILAGVVAIVLMR